MECSFGNRRLFDKIFAGRWADMEMRSEHWTGRAYSIVIGIARFLFWS